MHNQLKGTVVQALVCLFFVPAGTRLSAVGSSRQQLAVDR